MEGEFRASGGLDFARKDMALESTSSSSSLGISLGGGSLMSGGIASAAVFASQHEEIKGFDQAQERANVEALGGSYDITRVKEEHHSSGFHFSADMIGLAGLMWAIKRGTLVFLWKCQLKKMVTKAHSL